MSNNLAQPHFTIIVNAALLAFFATSLAAQQPTAPPPSPSPVTAPQMPDAATPPKSAPGSNVRRAIRRSTYLCAGGAKLVVSTSGSSTRIIFKDHIYVMKPVNATSGAKYSDGSVVWWIQDDVGFLQDTSEPSKNELLAKGCHLQQSPPQAKP